MTTPVTDSPFVIRALHSRALREARVILEDARIDAARIQAGAEAERVDILARARAEGLVDAARVTAGLAAEAAAALALFWAEREAELRDLALAVAHRVLSQLPSEELMARLATEAIAEHSRDTALALRVSPELLVPLRAALDGKDYGDRVTITADPGLPPGACALMHPRGRTELGLLAQFRAMMAAAARPEATTA